MDMNIHHTTSNQFTNYSEKSVTIKDTEYRKNILVTNNNIQDFENINITEIVLDDLETLLNNDKPDLIIFGTGSSIKYPNGKLLMELQKKGIGVEVMPIQALCRTFNFLISEDRKIAAILLFSNN